MCVMCNNEIAMFWYVNIILQTTWAEKNFYEIWYRILRQSGYLLKPVECINCKVFVFSCVPCDIGVFN